MRTSAPVPPGARLRRRNSSCRRGSAALCTAAAVVSDGLACQSAMAASSLALSGPKRCASASKKAMRGPVVSSAYLASSSLASATPDASPRPVSSSSHSSTKLSERAAGAARRSRARSSSARPRSVMLDSISPKKEVFMAILGGPAIRYSDGDSNGNVEGKTTGHVDTANGRVEVWTKARQHARGSRKIGVSCCLRSGHAGSVGRSSRPRTRPYPGRAVGRPGAGRPGRRRRQGGALQDRRRHPRLGAALHRRQGRRPSRRRLFPFDQPRQALDRVRFRDRRGQAHRQKAGGALRRADRELQGRRPRQVRARLQEPRAGLPAADLLLGDRLRPGRPLRDARRLRSDGAGHGRLHVAHRDRRRRADPRRRPGVRHHDRHVFGDRHSRCTGAARAHRQGLAMSTPRWSIPPSACWRTRD